MPVYESSTLSNSSCSQALGPRPFTFSRLLSLPGLFRAVQLPATSIAASNLAICLGLVGWPALRSLRPRGAACATSADRDGRRPL